MKDIAREFGTSVATVSRALSDNPRISAKRREEIQRYAAEHNFCPNLIAGSLRNNKIMKVIGVIIPEFTHYYFSSILSGIEQYASAHGYRLMVAQSTSPMSVRLRYASRSIRVRSAASLSHRPRTLSGMSISRT